MRQTKRKPKKVVKKAIPSRGSVIDIRERIASAGRGESDQIIYLGNLVERITQGEFGAVLFALIDGRAAMDLTESRQHGGTLPADRFLGRLDAYEKIKSDLEQYILDKDTAIRKLRDSNQPVHEQYGPEEIPIDIHV